MTEPDPVLDGDFVFQWGKDPQAHDRLVPHGEDSRFSHARERKPPRSTGPLLRSGPAHRRGSPSWRWSIWGIDVLAHEPALDVAMDGGDARRALRLRDRRSA